MKAGAVAALSSLAGAASFDGILDDRMLRSFEEFTKKFDKTYETDKEWARRLGIFAENVQKMFTLNEEHIYSGGEAVHGVTKFMDLTPQEFKTGYLTYKAPVDGARRVDVTTPGKKLADSVDWRTKDVVTPVKDQGQCGSCWAFSATEAIESFANLYNNQTLYELSPQQINSCDKTDGGCNGGNTETAYAYVKSAGGVVTGESYPYTSGTSGETGACKVQGKKKVVSISGYTAVKQGEDNLQSALSDIGPVSICVAANAFQTYSGGILKVCPGTIDHCVQAVGYGEDGGEKYWLVRNSWGTGWGEKGYIRVQMGQNLCMISNDVTYPTFDSLQAVQ